MASASPIMSWKETGALSPHPAALLPASTVAATTVARPSQSPPYHLRGRQPGPQLIVVEDNATAARMATPLTDDNLSDTATR